MVQARYQYETSPRKTRPDYNTRGQKQKKKPIKVVKDAPKEKAKHSGMSRRKQVNTTFAIIGVFIMFMTISCRNSQIDRKFNEIQDNKKKLSALEKENEQLKVSIENSVNLNYVKKVATEELGMQTRSTKQTIYVTLPKKDYVESASEKVIMDDVDDTDYFGDLINKFMNFFK